MAQERSGLANPGDAVFLSCSGDAMCLLMHVPREPSLPLVGAGERQEAGGVPPPNPSKPFQMERGDPVCVLGYITHHLETECLALWTPLRAAGQNDESVCHRT